MAGVVFVTVSKEALLLVIPVEKAAFIFEELAKLIKANPALRDILFESTTLSAEEAAKRGIKDPGKFRFFFVKKPGGVGISRAERRQLELEWMKAEAKYSKVAPKNALTPAKAFEEIDEFRRLGTGLEPLGPRVPVKGDGLGTVALIENEGRQFFGVNSSILSDASKDLGREVFSMMQKQGLLKGATAYGQGAAQVLTHAEAHALMRMWQKLGPNMPAEVTIFVDRYTCANCQKYLGEVAKTLGVKNLKVVTKRGETIPIAIP